MDGDALMRTIVSEAATAIPADKVRKKFLYVMLVAFEDQGWTGARKLKGIDAAYNMALLRLHPEAKREFTDPEPVGKERSPKHKDITIPFGEKFPGKLVCECPDWYLKWLREQSWVAEKFKDLYEQAGIELTYRDKFPSERIGPQDKNNRRNSQ